MMNDIKYNIDDDVIPIVERLIDCFEVLKYDKRKYRINLIMLQYRIKEFEEAAYEEIRMA